jgi:hypothetical protein
MSCKSNSEVFLSLKWADGLKEVAIVDTTFKSKQTHRVVQDFEVSRLDEEKGTDLDSSRTLKMQWMPKM